MHTEEKNKQQEMWASEDFSNLRIRENLKYRNTKTEMIDSVSLFLGWLSLKTASRVSHVTRSLTFHKVIVSESSWMFWLFSAEFLLLLLMLCIDRWKQSGSQGNIGKREALVSDFISSHELQENLTVIRIWRSQFKKINVWGSWKRHLWFISGEWG